MTVRVAIIDSGFDDRVTAGSAQLFNFDGEKVETAEAQPDVHCHGSALAAVVKSLAPKCALINAQVFAEKMAASPSAIAAALDWSVQQGAQLVNMSFGLADDREVMRSTCEGAVKKGVLLLAAAPARGGPVYPAAYPGVLRISGDARLKPGEVSILGSGGQADYGGCVVPGGASFAVAQIVGIAADWIESNTGAGLDGLCAYLDSVARFDKPERITGAKV